MIKMLLTSFLAIYAQPILNGRWGEIGAFRKKSMFEKSICFQFLGFLEKKIIFLGGSTILNYVKILYVSAPCDMQ